MSEASPPSIIGVTTPESLPAASARAIDEAIAAAALRIERILAAIRVPFFAAILARFWLFSETNADAEALTSIPIVAGIAYSLYVLAAVRRPPRSEALWLLSVSIDALACFGALLPNALWPAPGQLGVLFMPDTGIVFVVTVGAGLRLSRPAALFGSALSVFCLLVLIGADRAVSGARHAVAFDVVSLAVIYMVGCAALAVVLATTTRRLARRGALEAFRADRAERGLGVVLSDHHDVRSLLTSSIIDAELLASKEPTEATDGERQAALARRLVDRLRQIGAVVIDIKAKALGDLNALKSPEPVDVAAAVRSALDVVAGRRDGVDVRFTAPAEGAFALVAGGPPALQRILVNLLDNAFAGDGVRRAAAIVVSVRFLPEHGLVEAAVEDDGPGFPPEVLSGGLPQRSVKPGGLGVGLSVVRGLVEASGGVVRLANGEPRGASAIVRLPAAVQGA